MGGRGHSCTELEDVIHPILTVVEIVKNRVKATTSYDNGFDTSLGI